MNHQPRMLARDPAFDILSPFGLPAETAVIQPAARPAALAGRTVGLLDNSKKNADVFLDEIARLLRADGVAKVVSLRKPTAARPLGDLAARLRAECDAVVNAYGDCGSCTSWCVHDSIELETAGLPVATINSAEFVSLGRQEARALGMPMLPIVVVPHPIGSALEAVVRARAQAAYPEIVLRLTVAGADAPATAACAMPAPGAAAEDCGCEA